MNAMDKIMCGLVILGASVCLGWTLYELLQTGEKDQGL